MKPFSTLTLLILLFSLAVQTVFASAPAGSGDCAVTATLRMGSRGVQVKCLQAKVGAEPDGKFGPLTLAAVRTFQFTNGLKADGIVGPLTRGVLNRAIAKAAEEVRPEPAVKNMNPNLTGLDHMINTVVTVNRKNGFSEAELKIMADTLREKVLSSGRDYTKEFKELLVRESKLSADFGTHSPLTVFDKILAGTLSFLGISPSTAQAATGIQFGGRLIFAFRCDYNWMITITPLPPTNVTVLSYVDGTQGFASYNIPYTSWLLGYYNPPAECAIGETVRIPTQGNILPMTGSSPL